MYCTKERDRYKEIRLHQQVMEDEGKISIMGVRKSIEQLKPRRTPRTDNIKLEMQISETKE